jgi:hypothetical protein
MRSKHGSRVAWLAALVMVLGPLGTLRAATAPADAKAADKPAATTSAPASSSSVASSSTADKASSSDKAAVSASAKDAAPAKDAKADAGKDAQAGKDATADAGKTAEADKASVHHKSPGLAGGLAFFPGLVVHGTGHMYAGSWMKGLGLFAVEGAAAGIAAAAISSGYNDVQKIIDGSKNGQIPANVGTAYKTVGISVVSTMAFLWTWFDDMAGAPIAANEYNRLADEAAGQAHLQFAPNGDGAQVALVKHF